MKANYNCAIVGYGYMGQIRLRTINQIPDLKIKIVCDPNKKIIPKSSNYIISDDFKDIFLSVCTSSSDSFLTSMVFFFIIIIPLSDAYLGLLIPDCIVIDAGKFKLAH